MLLSKANIAVEGIAATTDADPELSCVHIAGDGTTVAANGRMMMAVEPVAEGSFFPIEERAELPDEGVSVPLHLIAQLRKILPRDKRPVMQQAAVTECDGEKIEMTTISKTEERKVAGRLLSQQFPRWREVFADSRRQARRTRICVSRKDLIQMLEAHDKASFDPSKKNVVFMEIGGEHDPILLRSVNLSTGQHAVGIVNPIDTGGMWISEDPWEKELYKAESEDGEDMPAVTVRKRIRKKKIQR